MAGMFGSNIKAGSAPRTTPFLTAAPKPLRVSVPTMPAAPHFAAPHVALHTPSLSKYIPSSSSSSGGSVGTFHAVSLAGMGNQAAPSKGGGGLMGDMNMITGFFGHLGSDIVRTTMGIPAGFVYMFDHPVAAGEQMVQATWHDWSPLFHGDVRTWAHNTYAHPLAPILDAVSFVTLGAGAAARGAALAGRVGEAAASADAAAAAADATAAAGRTAVSTARRTLGPTAAGTASDVAKAAGGIGTKAQAVTWWQKAARFGNPNAYAFKTYEAIGKTLGYTGDNLASFAQEATVADPAAVIRDVSKGGVTHSVKNMNRNPALAARDRWVRAGSDKLVAKVPKLGTEVGGSLFKIGENARYNRWSRVDRGSRRAAVTNLIASHVQAAEQVGKALHGMKPEEIAAHMHPTLRSGIIAHSMPVPLWDAAKGGFEAQVKQLAKEGKQAISSDAHYNTQTGAALQGLKAGKTTIDSYLARDWAKTAVSDTHPLIDAAGNLRVVSKGLKNEGKSVSEEAFFSHKVVKMLYTNPTKVWRYMLLGVSPRYFVNNFVGNSLMLIAATDPVRAFSAFHDYMHLRGLGKEANSFVTTAAQQLEHAARGGANNSLEYWMKQEHGFAMANMTDPATGKRMPRSGLSRAPSLHGFTHAKADMPQRYMAALATLKRMPIFQSAMAEFQAGGMSYAKALDAAVNRAMSHNAVRMQVREQVNHMLGQYHTFTIGERHVQRIIPFYSWDRAIAVHMKHLITQDPYKVAMGAALGSVGANHLQLLMGQVPDFMQSMIPAKMLSGPFGLLGQLIGKSSTGRMGVLNALSMSPYGSIGDETNALMAVAGMGHLRAGASLGMMLNPVIQASAAQIAGVDLTTGMPVKPGAGGPIVGTYLQAFGNIPQLTLGKALLGMEPPSVTAKGKPTLYEKNLQAALSSFLGVPMRQVNLATANALAAKQSGVKKPKAPSYPKKFPGL